MSRLKDLIARQETNKLVTDLVNLDRVRSLLKMIPPRRSFLARQDMRLNEQRGKLLFYVTRISELI